MNYAKAQSEIKDKYPPVAKHWHKYSFGGEVRCYENRLSLIDNSIVVYLGITSHFTDHWKVVSDKVIPNSPSYKRKKALNNDLFIIPIDITKPIFTRKNKWINLTEQIISVHPFRGKCCYCEVDLYLALNYSRDHIVPKSKGGKGSSNLKPCCCHCNCEKGDMILRDYIELLNRKWRRSITGSNEFNILTVKIKNANKIAKTL